MNLRELAEQDAFAIMTDSATGFGWPITITDPDGLSGSFTGFSADIAQAIDPDTGQVVSGRLATVAVTQRELNDKGMGHPNGVASKASRPWVVQFQDLFGQAYSFKVSEANPDRTIGAVVLQLEAYR